MSSPQTSHFALRASGGAPAAHGESCKTKPISGSPTGTGGKNVRNKAKLGRIGVSGKWTVMVCGATPPESGMCKTNPIPGQPGGWEHRIVQNKPNFPRGRVGRDLGDEGRTCKTNPISPVGRGPRGAKCAKRTQFRRADRPEPGGWLCKQTQLPAMCRSGDLRSREPSVPNKANLSITDCGFRIADWRHTSGGAANCAKRTQFGAARPACGRRSVQTKPIWRTDRARRSQSGGRNVQNEPNLPPDGQTGLRLEPIVQNEPNSEEAGRRGEYPAVHYSIIPPFQSDETISKLRGLRLPLPPGAATHGRGLRGGVGGDPGGLWPRRSMTIMASGQGVQGPGGFHW
jgi:hypothetical protein